MIIIEYLLKAFNFIADNFKDFAIYGLLFVLFFFTSVLTNMIHAIKSALKQLFTPLGASIFIALVIVSLYFLNKAGMI